MRSIGLEEAGRDPDFQLGREFLHREHGRVLVDRAGVSEEALVLNAAEIGAFEQFRRKDDFGAFARRFTHQVADRADVRGRVVGEGELEGSDGEFGHAVHIIMPAPAVKCSGSCRRR